MNQYERSKKTEISREKERETVLKISQAVSRTLDLNKILEMACRMTAQALGVERCSIGMVTSKDVYEIVHSYRAEPSYPSIAGVKFDLAEYPHLTAAYFSGKPIHLFDMNKRSLSSMELKLFKKLNLKVFLGIPIVVGGEVLGALHPGKVADPLPFSVSQIRLCQTIANQAGIAIRNAKLVKDLKDRYEQQSLLHNLSRSFFKTLNVERLFSIIARETCKALEMDRCSVTVVDQDRETIVIKSVYQYAARESSFNSRMPTNVLAQKFKLRNFRSLYSGFQKRGFFVTHSLLSLPVGNKWREYLKTTGIKSSLVVPIFRDSKIGAVLNISTVREHHIFTGSEIKLCQTIANLASLSLENASFMDLIRDQREEIRRKFKEQAILVGLSQALSRTLSLPKLLRIVTQAASEFLGIERVAGMLVEESTGNIFSYTVFSDGKHRTGIEGSPEHTRDFPVLTNYLRTKRVFCSSDISRSAMSQRELEYFRRTGVRSILAVPFAVGHRILGILTLTSVTEYHEFTESEIRVSQAIANGLSVAIENSRLVELLEQRSTELEKLSKKVIQAHEEERKNLASRLHDLVAQDLSAVKINLKLVQKALPDQDEEVSNRLKESVELLSTSIESLRGLTLDLRPPVLDDFGLASALRRYVDGFNRRTDLRISLKIHSPISQLSPETETTVYRMIQEALANVAKHARASRGIISLGQKGDKIRVIVQDDGIGFDPRNPSVAEGYGLFALTETAKLLEGKLEIFSQKGKGTKLVLILPFKNN